jgi:hypothetical protein
MTVGGWLQSLGLERYEAAFRENEIDETVLPSLTAEEAVEAVSGRARSQTLNTNKLLVRFAKTLPPVALYGMCLLCSSFAIAEPLPPREACRAASKIEYDSAKRQFLLINRHGVYLRTGHFWNRHYWYCPP